MHRYAFFLTFVLLLFPVSAFGGKPGAMIEFSVRCVEENPCQFSGEMIDVELELFNAGSTGIGLPVEYFCKQGPRVILVDNHSGKEKRLGMGPPMSHLFDEMQELAPGQSIKIPWMVAPDEIDDFALRPVDITAVFVFDLTPRLPFAESQFVRAPLRIVAVGAH
jgi:hypothetical protein